MNEKMSLKKLAVAIILSLLSLVISQIAAQGFALLLSLINIPAFICNVVGGISYIALCYMLMRILCSKVLKYEMQEFDIPKPKLSLKWVVIAFILPLSVSAVYLMMGGSIVSSDKQVNEALSIAAATIFFTGLGAGIVEEIVFRGIIMNALSKRFNKLVAVIAPSLLFGLIHIIGMKFDFLSCLLVVVAGTLVGIMFSLITIETHSVWNSAIVHAVWNIVIIGGFFTIGTSIDQHSLYTYIINSKSFILTGGDFGIEASIVSVIGYAIVAIIAYLGMKKNTHS